MKVRVLLISALLAAGLHAETPAPKPDTIIENYTAATRRQADLLQNASAEVAISGFIPKLKKYGELQARRLSQVGRITYEALRFTGDDTVKRNVIAKYMQAEEQGQQDPSIAVTLDNYKFKYKGRTEVDGREAHRFEVTPKKKRQGLYRGELWIDAETFLRVQESGRLVKNPSIALRKVEFVRRYEIRDGVSFPRQLQTIAETWLVGKAELTVDYVSFSFDSKSAYQNDSDR